MMTRNPTMMCKALFSVVCLVFASSTNGADETDPLATLRPAHPRLLFTAEDQRRIQKLAESDSLPAQLIELNRAEARKMLGEKSTGYEAGRRSTGSQLARARTAIKRVLSMGLAYRLHGDERFATEAINEMLVVAAFKDWYPNKFLSAAEMTTAMAIGYDWLYDEIKPSDRKTIRRAIVEKGLKASLTFYERDYWWASKTDNWNQVCNGGMILGALAIAEDEPDLAREILAHARRSMPHGLSVYKPDGAYPEGPMYWGYGTSYTCLTIRALQTALGHDFDISKSAGLKQTGAFRIQAFGPTGLSFNYADSALASTRSSAVPGKSTARLVTFYFFLSRIYDNPMYAWWGRKQLAEGLAAGLRPRNQFFPLVIISYDERARRPTETELPLDAFFKGRQDVVFMRSKRDDPNAAYVGFKGGDNRIQHGNMDIGSFVFDADGVRWAIDFGKENYSLPGYFSMNARGRWKYYRLNNRGHNTLVINDQLQDTKAQCKVIAHHSTPERVGAIVDMTDAYKGQARSARRGIELLDRQAVHVRDELTGVNGEVRWGIVTEAEIKLAGNEATLTQNGKTLRAEILAPPQARFEIVSTKPPTAQEMQNEGTRMLATRISVDGKEPVVVSILLQPGSKATRATPIKDRPLDEWPGHMNQGSEK